MVWIDVMASDDAGAARRARALFDDPRVTQFHDPDQVSGRAWSATLGVPGIAWDVYLLHDPGAEWVAAVPPHRDWYHQLGGEHMDRQRLRTGHALALALHAAGRAAGWSLSPDPPAAGSWEAAREAAMAKLSPPDLDDDGRCATCRDAGRQSSCSLGGWKRLLMRWEEDGLLMVSGADPASEVSGRHVVRLAISGMECPECMLHAGAGVVTVDGVAEVEVTLQSGRMRIVMAPGVVPAEQELVAAVTGQGFGARAIPAPAGEAHP